MVYKWLEYKIKQILNWQNIYKKNKINWNEIMIINNILIWQQKYLFVFLILKLNWY